MEQLVLGFSLFWSDAGVVQMARMCPNLISLDLNGCDLRNLHNLDRHQFAFNSLAHLDVSFCRKLGLRSLKLLMQHCPVLRELDLSETLVADDVIEYLAHEWPFRLEHLAVRNCERITEAGLFVLATKMLLPVQRTLSHIDVSWCFGATNVSTMFSLITLARPSLDKYDSQEDNHDARRLGLRDHRHIRIDFQEASDFDVLKEILGGEVMRMIDGVDSWVCCPGKAW
eukprot:TRINITY_DN6050_c0_g1_i4.p1 TRINITY_DN6050_c0_g1~~TRINITY_DN6050_c0_g1_i4.p1  ORF type:complete len:227 (-),score=11.54 TRINITY_DN6050_c0_g1_i4:85-765(-)